MGRGRLLRVPRDGSGARLVDPPARRPQGPFQVPVTSRAVFELQQSGFIFPLKPERQPSPAQPGVEEGVGYRVGLRDLGVTDFDDAEYWGV